MTSDKPIPESQIIPGQGLANMTPDERQDALDGIRQMALAGMTTERVKANIAEGLRGVNKTHAATEKFPADKSHWPPTPQIFCECGRPQCPHCTMLDIGAQFPFPPRIPYVCPVCEGRGVVPAGFYDSVPGQAYSTSSIAPHPCRSCGGGGIVWSK